MKIIKEYISKEKELIIMETVLFTDTIIEELTSKPISAYREIIDLVSIQNNLNARFYENGVSGNINDIKKAQKIFINSIKFN
jgi:hypothetical protein